VLHDDEEPIAVVGDFMNRADVRMIERGGCARLAMKLAARIAANCSCHQLDSHVALQLCVARTINFAHPAGAEQADDFVPAESSARRKAHLQCADYTYHDVSKAQLQGTSTKFVFPHKRFQCCWALVVSFAKTRIVTD
jgi:hypothetical protein